MLFIFGGIEDVVISFFQKRVKKKKEYVHQSSFYSSNITLIKVVNTVTLAPGVVWMASFPPLIVACLVLLIIDALQAVWLTQHDVIPYVPPSAKYLNKVTHYRNYRELGLQDKILQFALRSDTEISVDFV